MLSGYLTAYRKALKKWAIDTNLINDGLRIVYLNPLRDIQFNAE